ncbi:kinase-like domain-containing protein [Crucibulum laeve]|uniref:non-specific serine/threonine protein kinase n=1 Tax=Crucibulum laeve TaxID=68775 RepID=A0A5C3M6K3_9AGAR|nr:kinase-like domain-containing protein [Crucibulum laeve]
MVRTRTSIGPWKLGEVIGKGSTGCVKIARHSKTVKLSAVKIISKVALGAHELRHAEDPVQLRYTMAMHIEREIVVMKLVDHPNIMKLYDVWETPTHLYLILEYVPGGELFKHLCKRGPLPTSEALHFFRQIIDAVDYCHRFNIAHRDLKPENILLDEEMNIKLADFGMAAWLVNDKDKMLRTSCGSPHYACPEVVVGTVYDGTSSDIWSCGVILFVLLAGYAPFDSDNLNTLRHLICHGIYSIPDHVDPRAKDLIKKMLVVNPQYRITMAEIRCHKFFTSNTLPTSVATPDLASMLVPILGPDSVDPDIFANLCVLWHGTSEGDLLKTLMSPDKNLQKGVYFLLSQYREQRVREHEQEENDFVKDLPDQNILQLSGEPGPESQDRSSPITPPPRVRAPTPHSAARRGPSDSSDITDAPLRSFRVESSLQSPQTDSSLQPVQAHSSVRSTQVTPSSLSPSTSRPSSPLKAICAALRIDFPDVSDLENNRMTDVFRRFLDRLQVPDANNGSDGATAPTTADHFVGLTRGTFQIPEFESSWCVDALGTERQPPTAPIASQSWQVITAAETDISTSPTAGRSARLRRRLPRKGNKPDRYEQVPQRRKSLSEAPGPTLSSHDPIPFSPDRKRKWVPNLFKSKPSPYVLSSRYAVQLTRNECLHLLVEMGVHVKLENPEGLGRLKCDFSEAYDPAIQMGILKDVKFTVDIQLSEDDESLLSLVLSRISGSAATLQEIFLRLQREWRLDSKVEGVDAAFRTVSPPSAGCVPEVSMHLDQSHSLEELSTSFFSDINLL